MTWLFYAFLTMALATTAAIVQKKTLEKENALEFATIMAVSAFILTTPLWWQVNYDALSLEIVALMYGNSVLNMVAYYLVARAMHDLPISTVSPLLLLGPAVTAILAYVFLGEALTTAQIGGLALLMTGTYVLESHKHGGVLQPFKTLVSSRATEAVLGALLIYGISGTVDKFILGAPTTGGYGITASTYMPFIHAFIAMNFLIFYTVENDLADLYNGWENAGPWVFTVAFLTVSYRYSQQHALTFENAKVAIVVAVKKMSSFFTTLIGGEVFSDKALLKKSLACIVMIAGGLLVVL